MRINEYRNRQIRRSRLQESAKEKPQYLYFVEDDEYDSSEWPDGDLSRKSVLIAVDEILKDINAVACGVSHGITDGKYFLTKYDADMYIADALVYGESCASVPWQLSELMLTDAIKNLDDDARVDYILEFINANSVVLSKKVKAPTEFYDNESEYCVYRKDYSDLRRTNSIDLNSNEILRYEDQLAYEKAFVKKYGRQYKHLFYFDDVELVDAETSRTIRGAELDRSTCRQMTCAILNHFRSLAKLNRQ